MKLITSLAFIIGVSLLALNDNALATQSPRFQSGICEFDGPDNSSQIVRNIPNATCSISIKKRFDTNRYIVMAQTGHAANIHWLWRSGPSYSTKISPKSAKVCNLDKADRRSIGCRAA